MDIVLEGGSFHTDGDGTVIVVEECLRHTNRNPNLSQEEMEHTVLHHLGGTKMIWLPWGLAYDEDTNGHVDNMVAFTKPGEVVLSWTDEECSLPKEPSWTRTQTGWSWTWCGSEIRVYSYDSYSGARTNIQSHPGVILLQCIHFLQ